MQKVIYTNSYNNTLEIGSIPPFLLQGLTGLGTIENNIITQKAPLQDGSTVIYSNLNNRNITLTITIKTNSTLELHKLKAFLTTVFNPKISGEFTYINDYTTRVITCRCENGVEFSELSAGTIRAFISLLCYQPFWRDAYVETEQMADWVGGFNFPLTLPTSFATRSTRTDTLVVNKGNVETPVIVEFIGDATNPKLINKDTNEFIKVNRTIKENEKLVINTEFGNKQVDLINMETGEKESAFGYLDLDSTFFSLKVGDNKLNFSADSGSPRVYVKWENRYVGV